MKHLTAAFFTLAMATTSPVLAEAPAFMGTWSSTPSCPDYDAVTYGKDAVETDYSYCEYKSVEKVGDNRWQLQSDCHYEGSVTAIETVLLVNRDTMHEAVSGQRPRDLVRCLKQ